MILGVDHLAYSATDTKAAIKELEQKGFSCFFFEENIPNDPAKKPLLKEYRPLHDLAVMRPVAGGLAIEITNHGDRLADDTAPYTYHKDQIELETSDINIEKEFWQKALRFKQKDQDTLKLISPIPNWSCTLRLKENKSIKPCTLDSRGYPCLAFLTNNISKDIKSIKDAGAVDIIKGFKSLINKKNLDIVMFRTAGGALCEFIEIKG